MAAPLSVAVREKIVSAYEKKVGSQAYIAEIFGITRRTISNLLRQNREKGDLTPKKQTGRPPSIDSSGLKLLKKIVIAQPDKTIAEYCELFENQTKIYISSSVMGRALQTINLRRKKKSFSAQEQNREDVKKKTRFFRSGRWKGC